MVAIGGTRTSASRCRSPNWSVNLSTTGVIATTLDPPERSSTDGAADPYLRLFDEAPAAAQVAAADVEHVVPGSRPCSTRWSNCIRPSAGQRSWLWLLTAASGARRVSEAITARW
jgi:hypothetical protein